MILGLAMAAWAGSALAADARQAQLSAGRFQVIQPHTSGGHAVLLDTFNGNSWRLAVTPADPAKGLEPGNMIWFWSPLAVSK